jgi:hypothetical protein
MNAIFFSLSLESGSLYPFCLRSKFKIFYENRRRLR